MAWAKVGSLRPGLLAVRVPTAVDGTFALALPAGLFKSPPVATAAVQASDGRDHVATLTSVTSDAVTGRARRSRALPSPLATLPALAGYDPFEPSGIVTVHLIVAAA